MRIVEPGTRLSLDLTQPSGNLEIGFTYRWEVLVWSKPNGANRVSAASASLCSDLSPQGIWMAEQGINGAAIVVQQAVL